MKPETLERFTRIKTLLEVANVGKPVVATAKTVPWFDGKSQNMNIETPHPLHDLYASQDADGRERGLTVPCGGDYDGGCRLKQREYSPGVASFMDNNPQWATYCICHGTGRTLPTWVYVVPESAVRGWVEFGLLSSVGWFIAWYVEEVQIGDNPRRRAF